jgi:hypothetical protein
MSVVVVVVLNFFPSTKHQSPSRQKPSSEDHLKQKSRFPTAGKLFVRC